MAKAIEDVRAMPDEEFMSKYEDLVHHFIWKRYKGMLEIVKANTGLEMEDLVQYGMMGLIKARRILIMSSVISSLRTRYQKFMEKLESLL